MSEPTTSGEQGEVEYYEFVAAGENSCERCAALAGSTWREPPDPPHAHCECEVSPKLKGRHAPRACGDNTWSMQPIPGGGQVVRYGPGGQDGFEWGFIVTVDCWDGNVWEFEIWVDMGADADWPGTPEGFEAMDDYAWNQVYDEAEAVAAQACTPCTAPLVS